MDDRYLKRQLSDPKTSGSVSGRLSVTFGTSGSFLRDPCPTRDDDLLEGITEVTTETTVIDREYDLAGGDIYSRGRSGRGQGPQWRRGEGGKVISDEERGRIPKPKMLAGEVGEVLVTPIGG